MKKKSKSKSNKNALDYLIVNTGYTSRLVTRLGFDKVDLVMENAWKKKKGDKIRHNNIYKVGYSFDYKSQEGIDKIRNNVGDSCEELDNAFTFDDRPGGVLPNEYITEFDEFINSCLYIYDDLWGNGLYKVSDNDEEINKVIAVLDANKIGKYGTVCFRCKSRDDIKKFTKIIRKLDYCQMFDYEGDEYVDTDELIITVASFDTESG